MKKYRSEVNSVFAHVCDVQMIRFTYQPKKVLSGSLNALDLSKMPAYCLHQSAPSTIFFASSGGNNLIRTKKNQFGESKQRHASACTAVF